MENIQLDIEDENTNDSKTVEKEEKNILNDNNLQFLQRQNEFFDLEAELIREICKTNNSQEEEQEEEQNNLLSNDSVIKVMKVLCYKIGLSFKRQDVLIQDLTNKF